MKIWIYFNGLQQGPYSLDQLRLMPLTPETPVWYDGLPEWIPAGQAPVTAVLFESTSAEVEQPSPQVQEIYIAPAGNGAETTQRPPRKPSTYMVWNILLTVLCCSPFALAGIVTGAVSNSRYNSGDYNGARRMSHVTEWLLIISVVWMIIGLPVAIIFNNL